MGGVNEGGEHVGEVDEVFVGLAGFDFAGPVGYEGDVGAEFGGAAFAAGDFLAVYDGGDSFVASIVAGENDEGVCGEVEGF